MSSAAHCRRSTTGQGASGMTQTEEERAAFAAPHAEGLELVKRAIVGSPMPSDAMEETLLRKRLALPIFASDPFSSVAYATEAAMVVLVGTSIAGARLVFPLSLAVSALLVIVIVSYRQTVKRVLHERRIVRRLEGEPRAHPESRCRRGAPRRLRAHGRRLGRGRHPRHLLGGSFARPLHRLRCPSHRLC